MIYSKMAIFLNAKDSIMSFQLSFFPISADDVIKVDEGKLHLADYEHPQEATLDFYTQDFIDLVMSEMLPLSVLMTEGDERYSEQIDGGIYYSTGAIDEIVHAFNETDLNKLADMLDGNHDHCIATLTEVKNLFSQAQVHNQVIIGFF